MKFEAEGQEFANFLRSLEIFIQTLNDFITCSNRSNKLEQLEFKLEKLLGFRNMLEKFENYSTVDSILICMPLFNPFRITYIPI